MQSPFAAGFIGVGATILSATTGAAKSIEYAWNCGTDIVELDGAVAFQSPPDERQALLSA